MGMSLRTNVSSLDAQRNVFMTETNLDSSLAKLSSGYRITKAGDDAAGLAISSALTSQIRSYGQAARNAQDGLSVIQTAEAALDESTNLFSRLRELAMQSASDTVSDTERGYITDEVTQLTSEIDRIANGTEFNNRKLLDGTAATLNFQVGIRNNSTTSTVSFSTVDARFNTLVGTGGTFSLATQSGAVASLDMIDTAIESISSARATMGAAGNRLESAVATIKIDQESLSAANSRIRDVDVAEETSNMSRNQILMQAGVSVLAQANQMPQLALKLLG